MAPKSKRKAATSISGTPPAHKTNGTQKKRKQAEQPAQPEAPTAQIRQPAKKKVKVSAQLAKKSGFSEDQDAVSSRTRGKMPVSSTAMTTEVKKEAPKSKSGKAQKKAVAPTPKPKNEKGKSVKVVKKEETKKIVIEHCKQCNSFKVQATKVQAALKAAIPTLEVSINPDKPRRGCFEVRDADGTTYISLHNLQRPFKKLKELDLDTEVKKIVENLKA